MKKCERGAITFGRVGICNLVNSLAKTSWLLDCPSPMIYSTLLFYCNLGRQRHIKGPHIPKKNVLMKQRRVNEFLCDPCGEKEAKPLHFSYKCKGRNVCSHIAPLLSICWKSGMKKALKSTLLGRILPSLGNAF